MNTKLTKESKITQGRFYEVSVEKTTNGIEIKGLPDDVARHMGLSFSRDNYFINAAFTVINGVMQVAKEPKTDTPLFSPDDFETSK